LSAETDTIYKADNYNVPVPVINGKLTPSFASIRDEKKISAIRRHVQHAFSTTGILDYEEHIDETIQVLVANLRDSGSHGNLQQWLSFFTFDTMCRLAFSDDPGMMNRQQDVGRTMEGGRERFLYWNDWFAIPKIEGILYKNRFVKNIVTQNILTKMAIERVQDRMQKGDAGTHQDLMDSYFQAREKSPALFDIPTISSITLSTIHAGSETTGHTLTYVFWNLFKTPKSTTA
jgi:cytochrome P450